MYWKGFEGFDGWDGGWGMGNTLVETWTVRPQADRLE